MGQPLVPALDLELTTLRNYRYMIEVHILPEFGEWPLSSLTAEEISTWERQLTQRSYSRRTVKDARDTLTTPAADGWYPERSQRAAVPVLVDAALPFPGRPVPPWPAAAPGEPFEPPAGRGITRLTSDTSAGRCHSCGRAQPRRRDGRLVTHNAPGGGRCDGSGQMPAEDVTLACWRPVLPGLTPHGLRHGHQTWLEEAGVSDLLRSERMGHEVPGMRGVYAHVSPAMRADLKAVLQERWEGALRERVRLSPRSIVPVLDELLLAAQWSTSAKIGSRLAPKIGHKPESPRPQKPT